MPQTIYIPHDRIAGPNVHHSDDGAEIRRSSENPVTIIAGADSVPQEARGLSSITVSCTGGGGFVSHISVEFDEWQVLDTNVFDGSRDFTLPGRQDVKARESVQDLMVILKVNIPSDTAGLIIKSIKLQLDN